MQMIRSGDNRKTQLLSQLDQKIFFSVEKPLFTQQDAFAPEKHNWTSCSYSQIEKTTWTGEQYLQNVPDTRFQRKMLEMSQHMRQIHTKNTEANNQLWTNAVVSYQSW